LPSASVIDTRKSAGMLAALAAAAAVTDSSEALRYVPALFFTAPYEMLFWSA
jgi:hypothetical protein